MGDFIQFRLPERGADDVLHTILEVHNRYQAMQNLRRCWVHVLALLGGLMAWTLVFPETTSEPLRENMAAAWVLCCACAVATAIQESVGHRHEQRLLAENKRVIEEQEAHDSQSG